MPCYDPLPAWRTKNGTILLAQPKITDEFDYYFKLPCNKCIGCELAARKAWALRCQLELQQHDKATWSNLTYAPEHRPPTLEKRHIQLLFKRLRRHYPDRTIRYFYSGEYGEHTKLPHYHAIIFGVATSEHHIIQKLWNTGRNRQAAKAYRLLGHVRSYDVTPKNIAYTAGYTAKKIGNIEIVNERVDPDTGEIYKYQPPYIDMSRNPGIGAHAKKWIQSWRLYAVKDGTKMPVPRYYHEAWKALATEEEIETLLKEKQALSKNITPEALEQAWKNAIAKNAISRDKRKY